MIKILLCDDHVTGKFARVALGTRYIDYNGRFCMSSAAGGFLRSFGVDRGSTLPWTDIHETDCLFIAGSNTAECHPTSMFRVWNVQERGGYIIVADPRETPIARRADVHLDISFILTCLLIQNKETQIMLHTIWMLALIAMPNIADLFII